MIGLASDHAGFELKEFIKNYIVEKGYVCKDFGAYSAESCDYPDFAHALAIAVETGEMTPPLTPSKEGDYSPPWGELEGACSLGIAMCGSGNGISMTLNKYHGIRAAICWNVQVAQVTRAHNDANILVLPARFISNNAAIEMVDTFLNTPFEGGRHQRRIEKISIKI